MQGEVPALVFGLSLISPLNRMTRWTWWIPLQGIHLIGIHGIGLTTSVPTTPTTAMTGGLIAIWLAIEATKLTIGLGIVGIKVTPALLCKMARLATVVAFSS